MIVWWSIALGLAQSMQFATFFARSLPSPYYSIEIVIQPSQDDLQAGIDFSFLKGYTLLEKPRILSEYFKLISISLMYIVFEMYYCCSSLNFSVFDRE